MKEEDFIIIGNKYPSDYILAALSMIYAGATEIGILARGNKTSLAIDTAERIRSKFSSKELGEFDYSEIKIGTDVINIEGKDRRFSSIRLVLSKK